MKGIEDPNTHRARPSQSERDRERKQKPVEKNNMGVKLRKTKETEWKEWIW